MQQAEFETKLNRVCLHMYKEEHYKEDYQMPMLRQNELDGILEVEGCEVEGRTRYTYEISGMISMKSMYENTCIKKQEIQNIVTRILEVTEILQKYMLDPNCLVLKPEYMFYKDSQWFFCYFPDMEEDLCRLFHELTEYFVRMLDYEDTEGIFLAYELHKATLQEHYDLELIMKGYRSHALERNKLPEDKYGESEDKKNYKSDENQRRIQEVYEGDERQNKESQCDDYAIYGRGGNLYEEKEHHKGIGNIFYVTDEEDTYEKRQNNTIYEKYEPTQAADTIREEGGWWKSWRKAANGIRRKRWGSWEDLILETDGQEEENGL